MSHSQIKKYLDNNLKFADNGTYSVDSIFNRISIARNTYTKRENWFHLLSATAFSLYIIKTIGIKFDLIIFENSISESPYGIFIFCIICQISNIIAISQSLNIIYCNLILDNIRDRAMSIYSDDEDLSNPNDAEYFGENIAFFRRVGLGSISIVFYYLILILTSFFGVIFSIGSIGVGFHFLYNYERQIIYGNINWQYYPVLTFTFLNIIWLLFLIVVIRRSR